MIVALLVGGLAAVAWFLPQWRRAGKVLRAPEPSDGQIALTVRHNGPELELHWNTADRDFERAGGGKLTIIDGTHESKLNLDRGELRSGAALYWPQASHVAFRLDTAGGAWGHVDVPAWEVQQDEPLPVTGEAKAHRVATSAKKKAAAHSDHGGGSAKAGRSKHGKRAGEKIPSYWKMPSDE